MPQQRAPFQRRGTGSGSGKSRKADEVEALVWGFVSGLLKAPTRLKAGLEAKMEAERLTVARGDPDREIRAWLGQLEEIEIKRSRVQDKAAERLLTLEELGANLYSHEEAREVAEEELGRLRTRSERREALERDRAPYSPRSKATSRRCSTIFARGIETDL